MTITLLISFLISVIVFHICAIQRYKMSAVISKGIASALFVCIGAWMLYHNVTAHFLNEVSFLLIGNIYSKYYIYIFIGLICGFVGDILLALRNLFIAKRKQFIASGMIAFGLGHLAYSVAPTLLLFDISPVWILVPCLSAVMVVPLILKLSPRLGMELGKFTLPAILYGGIILFLLVSILLNCIFLAQQDNASIITWAPIIPVLLFTISDFMLSTNYFDKDQKPMSVSQIIIIHVTYYLAQLLFALGFTLSNSL